MSNYLQRCLATILIFPSLVLQPHIPSQPADPATLKVVENYLTSPPNPQFPDMTSNYEQTVVIPAQKAQEAAQEAAQVVTYTPPPPVVRPTGSCGSWMAAAGISDPATAYLLIMRESGCNPNAVNRYSGACGIGQQLPCGKWAHQWNDPVGAMIDMQNYVYAVYGSWGNAWSHELNYGYY